jgi:hypothetical protein
VNSNTRDRLKDFIDKTLAMLWWVDSDCWGDADAGGRIPAMDLKESADALKKQLDSDETIH